MRMFHGSITLYFSTYTYDLIGCTKWSAIRGKMAVGGWFGILCRNHLCVDTCSITINFQDIPNWQGWREIFTWAELWAVHLVVYCLGGKMTRYAMIHWFKACSQWSRWVLGNVEEHNQKIVDKDIWRWGMWTVLSLKCDPSRKGL